MDTSQPRYAFTGIEDLPPRDDDDELISVGDPIWDVVKVEAIGPLTLAVEFEDGLTGRVRFMPSYLTGVFQRLHDPVYFAQVNITNGAVSWPNNAPDMAPDMAPDHMYNELVRYGGELVLQ